MIIDYHLIDFKKRQVIGPRGNECRALIGPNPDVRNVPQCCGMLRNVAEYSVRHFLAS